MFVNQTKAREAAYLFLAENDVFEFPIDVSSLIRKCGWYLSDLEEAARMGGLTPERFRSEIMRGGDGVVFHNPATDECRIVYEKKEHANFMRRLRFTLAHEIGHIALGHLKGNGWLNHNGKDEGCTARYMKYMEKEADYFAGVLLAPTNVMLHHGVKDEGDIKKYFGLSSAAAKVKRSHLKFVEEEKKIPAYRFFDELYRDYWGDERERFGPKERKQILRRSFPGKDKWKISV